MIKADHSKASEIVATWCLSVEVTLEVGQL